MWIDKWLLAALGIAWLLLGAVTAFLGLFVAFLFDAPGSNNNPATIAIALGIVTCPFACAFSLKKIWAELRSEYVSQEWKWLLLPLVSVAVGGAGLAWVMLAQNGKFTG